MSVHCDYEGGGMLGSCIQLKLVLLILSLKCSGCASWLSKCSLYCTLTEKWNYNEVLLQYVLSQCATSRRPEPTLLSSAVGGWSGVWWPHLRPASTTGTHIRPLSTLSTLSTVYTPLPLSLLFSSPILHPPATLNTLTEAAHYYHLMLLLTSTDYLLLIYHIW